MKRRAVLTAIILIIAVLSANIAFAENTILIAPAPSGTLQIVKTVPDNGEEGKQVTNMAVKIVFDEDVSASANDAANANCITIKDPDGKSYPFTIAHHPKSPNEIWCILEGDLVADTEYTVTVSAGVKATSGNTLSSPYTFTFKTRNTKTDTTISMVLTFAMMGIMIFATTRAQNKKREEDTAKGKGAAALEKQTQTDPYRLAKERGISVEEAQAVIAKEKEKIDKKNASGVKAREKYEADKAAKEAEIERRLKEIHDASVYKVKAKGSLVEHGGTLPKAVLKKQAARRKSKKK
ncbi:MAG: Ig-like domain-containing protein [Firmicutes bacterium]|nr:Ig-like domain-containing protein [Bacillota bacterium]